MEGINGLAVPDQKRSRLKCPSTEISTKTVSAGNRIRSFLEAHVGEVVTTRQIRRVAKISDSQRRIRELRDEEGMQIKSHIDRLDLKPGQYILESLKRVPVIKHTVPPGLRTQILERNGYTCRLCGAGASDPDPFNLSRKVRLHVDHINPRGPAHADNLRVLCSACNQGRSNIQTASETAVNLIARIRRSPRKVQREVYERFKTAFERD